MPTCRRLTRRAIVAVLAAAAAVAPIAPASAEEAASPQTYTAGAGDDMRRAFEQLRPGDTLLLEPGTYEIGYIRPVLARGTPSAPITVKPQVWGSPPVLVGGIELRSPDFWSLERLRVRAAADRAPALHLRGGSGWRVTAGEFWGARDTQAYANVAIDGSGGYPRRFTFAQNCVHDAATTTRSKTDHNIYVKFRGAPGSGGVISQNTVLGHPNGAGIKLGDGGDPGAPGPWGVQVVRNTIVDGGRQVLMSHDVRGNSVTGNLLGLSREPFTATDRRTTGLYALMVGGSGNTVGNNYVFGADMALRDPYGKVRVAGDMAVRPDAQMRGRGCSVQPAYWKARYYGRTSQGVYLSW
ncbi:hypothetical protein WDV85_00420 [Pseudokineococcus sp. 5B2Z-1]|uniref:hypothetical protein n=1 Tax=Pseudokineococcus sp. 5B2Z-1 TaxID=3132744 RepID=UPI00309C6D11